MQSTTNDGKTVTILWVTPGQILEQEFVISENVPGRLNLGQAKVVFYPLGNNLGVQQFSNFLKILRSGKYIEELNNERAQELILGALGILKNNAELQTAIHQTSILDLKRMSDDLFEIANSVIPQSFQKSQDSYFKPCCKAASLCSVL